MMKQLKRCSWPTTDLDIEYHDTEWGVPVHDDRRLFELLILEGAQAGLSWSTVLKKRSTYRLAFAEFDPTRVARFTPARVERLMKDPGIVRHRQKVESAVTNAKAFLDVQKEFGSFDRYVWQFVGGVPRTQKRGKLSNIPARTAESDALSKDLKRRGFKFVGSTICYAFKPREIDQSELNSVVGSVAHLAYHVGAIRQIDLSARGPSAND